MSAIYPTGVQYREALFDTSRCFKDPALTGGKPDLDTLGMPRPLSGGSASVFTVRNVSGIRIAIKCFTRFVPDQFVRYQRISQTLTSRRTPWQIDFEYLNDGVLCNGTWFPVLKMEWIEGTSLISYLESNLRDTAKLRGLTEQFLRLVDDLSDRGIAHGDLQHGNLLVTPSGELKLIDYDGMFVPGLEDVGASELGHPNYQSPYRTTADWGPFLDNFSSWVIYASLTALAIDPTMWALLHRDGDEALLFRKDDFVSPDTSRALRALAEGPVGQLQELRSAMTALWASDIRVIPSLNSFVTARTTVGVSAAPGSSHPDEADIDGAVPRWLRDVAYERIGVAARRGDSTWITEQLPRAASVPYEPRGSRLRILTGIWLAAMAAAGAWATSGSHLLLAEVPVTASTALVFPAVSSALYRATAGWQDKRTRRRRVGACRSDSAKAQKEVQRLRKVSEVIDNDEHKVLAGIAKRVAGARKSEEQAIAVLDKKRDALLAKIDKQKQSLNSREAAETARALSTLQQQHVDSILRAATISGARIPGIGTGVASSLAAYGIRSAADFSGIAYGPGRGGSQQVYIRLRSGGSVHPQGVGQKKATSLESWRRSVEARARASRPSSLPAGEANSIRARFAEDLENLILREGTARTDAASKVQAVRQEWAPIQITLSNERMAAQGDFAQRRAKAEGDIVNAQENVTNSIWRQALARRDLEIYKNVTYTRYLSRLVKK